MSDFIMIVHHPVTTITVMGRCSGDSSTQSICYPEGEILLDTSDCGLSLTRIYVGNEARLIAASSPCSIKFDWLESQFVDFLNGRKKQFSGFQLDCSGLSPFSCTVLRAAQKIPYGTQVSYSKLALDAGHPEAVRAAASVMRKNRFPLVIPCHRVISKSGKTGAYCGSRTGEDAELKRALIVLESSG